MISSSSLLCSNNAINYLQSCLLPLSVSQAVHYLEYRQNCATILSLYQHFFSTEWHSSTARLFPNDTEAHSPRELEFFKLVDKHLFPLCFWYTEDNSERLYDIAITPHDIDWWNYNLEDFSFLEQLLLSLMGSGHERTEWEKMYGIKPNAVMDIEEMDWEKLEQLCNEQETPLRYLYNTVSILDHSTEIVWLDSNAEMMEYVEWSVKNIEALTIEWKKAQLLLLQGEELEAWIKEDNYRIKQLVKLWNKAKKKPNQVQSNKCLSEVLAGI